MQPKDQAHDLVARQRSVAAALGQAIAQERHAIAARQPTNTRYWGEVVAQIRHVQTTAGLQVVLANVGNPDYRQDPENPLPGAPNRIVAAKDLAEASQLCRDYIRENDLGGGNWTGGLILKGGKEFARVHYGGSIWSLPERLNDKPIWPVQSAQSPAKKQTIDGVEPLEFEDAIVEIPGHGQLKISGCFRVAHCSTIPGKFTMGGRRMDFTTYLHITRSGIGCMQAFDLHPDGLSEVRIKAPKKLTNVVIEALREWFADPANAAMLLRNELADERHSLQVMERNIRLAERDLERRQEEANVKRATVEALRADVEGSPGPKF